MTVRMLTSMSGDSFSVGPGDEFTGDPAHEQRLIASGQAEAIEAPKPEPKAKAKK